MHILYIYLKHKNLCAWEYLKPNVINYLSDKCKDLKLFLFSKFKNRRPNN